MVRQPLALCTPDSGDSPFHVADLARVVAEIKFRKVAVQMFLRAVLIHAAHPALEDRKEAFDRIGMHVTAHVLAMRMRHGFMCGELPANADIEAAFVRL